MCPDVRGEKSAGVHLQRICQVTRFMICDGSFGYERPVSVEQRNGFE
jgi:hypothetical protein